MAATINNKTRWMNGAVVQRRGYDTYSNPLRALAIAILSVSVVDFCRLGVRRHHQRCRSGRDWIRYIPTKAGSYVPPVYREVRLKIGWLFGNQFGWIVDYLDLDLEKTQEFFLKLMAGPPVE